MGNFEERYQNYISTIKEDILSRRLLSDFWSVYDWAWQKNELPAKVIYPLLLISAPIAGVFRGNYFPKAALIFYALFIVSLIVYAVWIWKSLRKTKNTIGLHMYPFEMKHQVEKRIHRDMVLKIEGILLEMADKQDTWTMPQYEKQLQETVSFYERCLERVTREELN